LFEKFGRLRKAGMTPTSQTNGYDVLTVDGNMDLPNSKKGVYDYFVMDYQQNVRMILTEETHSASNICTMETGRATAEEPIFGQAGSNNEVATTRYAVSSTSWQNGSIGSSVSRLGNLAGHIIGPNTLQKVMAGDKVSAAVQYYFQTATGGSNSNFASALLSSLAQAITGGSVNSVVQENVTNVTSQLNLNPEFINSIQPGSTGNTPRAYLTILFFDERFNFIQAADGGAAQQQVVGSVGSSGSTLGFANIKAPKNGYVYIYISNQSDQDVYFDNFQAGIVTGNIIEENHYYAYGLKITSISSKKLGDVNEGTLKNNYQYQGTFNEFDDDIGWNDFELRNYDPQIGRWVQQDPYDQFPSPYSGSGDDPVNLIDPSGGIGLPCPGTSALVIFLDNFAFAASKFISSASPLLSKITLVIQSTSTALHIVQVIQTSNLINTQSTTLAVGGGKYYFNPSGGQIWLEDDSDPHFYNGKTEYVNNIPIHPMLGSVRSFTQPASVSLNGDDDGDAGTVRFVAVFSKTGVFTGYAWDQDLNYTYEQYMHDLREDLKDQLDHEDDPAYQHYNSKGEARRALASIASGITLPTTFIRSATFAINSNKLLRVFKSVEKVMGKTYRAINEVVVPVKNTPLLKELNAASKGKGVWEKVYQAGVKNGKKIEVHFFRNSKTGQVYDVKIKYNYWHQKAFKGLTI
jgi:RHS repeat-associated protein